MDMADRDDLEAALLALENLELAVLAIHSYTPAGRADGHRLEAERHVRNVRVAIAKLLGRP